MCGRHRLFGASGCSSIPSDHGHFDLASMASAEISPASAPPTTLNRQSRSAPYSRGTHDGWRVDLARDAAFNLSA